VSTTPASEPTGYLLCDDLMWMSRVMGEAKAIGCKIIPARTVEKMLQLIQQQGAKSVLLDLGQAEVGQEPKKIVEQLQQAGVERIIAYGSHVETEVLQSAREAGCHPVLARSKMAAVLPELLPSWLS
jgi:methylmalonyl-CoA mutase cobalamin-binding subunit